MSKKPTINRQEAARLRRIREGRAREGDAHSIKFWNAKFKELKTYAKNEGVEFPFRSRREFISDWAAISQDLKGTKGEVMKEMKYGLKYATRYKVALAEKKMIREITQSQKAIIEDDFKAGTINEDVRRQQLEELRDATPSLLDLKTMTTREFADKYRNEIMQRYEELKKLGKRGREAQDIISSEWFGSE